MANSERNTQAFYKTEIPSDWVVKEFVQICRVNQGLQIPIEERLKLFEPNSKVYITIQYLNNGKEVEYIKEYSQSVCCSEEDILMTRTGNTGIVVSGVSGVFHNNFFKINFDKLIVDRDYLISYLRSNKTQHEILVKAGTSTIPDLNHKDFYKIKVLIPPLPEQRTIAHVLGLMDDAINKNNQLIAQKEKRKKWLMQQLLTGKKRLKGFEGEWEEYKLGQLGDYYNGLTGKTKEDFGQGAPFITYMNVFSNSQIDINQVDYVNLTENDNQNSAKYGDIFFTVSSEIPNEVGMAAVLLDEVDQLFLNSFCFGFRLFNFESLHPKYAQYILRFDSFRESMILLAQGSTRFNISKSAVCQIKLNLPNIEEQLEIVNILTAADKEIGLLKAKADKLKEQKKGMMQVLLTGKKRLKI